MSTYVLRKVSSSKQRESYPFQMVAFTGDPLSEGKSSFMIKSGYCFSTFNYGKDTMVPIEGFLEPFELENNDAVYVDFTVLSNLQISGGVLKYGKVGEEALDGDWKDYPASYKVNPKDIYGEDGRVTTLVDGKRQENHYLLLGYCTNDESEKGVPMVGGGSGEGGSFKYVTSNKSNVIMMSSQASGVPIVFTMPYFNPVTIVEEEGGE